MNSANPTPTAQCKTLRIAPNTVSQLSDIDYERRALHEAVEIKYFYEGSSTLLIGTKTIIAKAGDVVVINPYEFHATIDSGNGRYHLFMIPLDHFLQAGIAEPNLKELFFAERILFPTIFSQHEPLQYVLTHLVEEQTADNPYKGTAILGLLLELFTLLLRHSICSQEPSLSDETLRSYRLVEPALRYIRDRYVEVISIDHLAALCCISKHHFCRVFKTATGQTAIEYLREHRLKIADMLLKNTNHSIAQIAVQCGFNDENYFCRCYKKHRNISPGKQRKSENAHWNGRQ